MGGSSSGSNSGSNNTVAKTISKIADFSLVGRAVKGIANSITDNRNRKNTDKNTANSRLSGSFTTEYNNSKGRTNNNSFANNDSGNSNNDKAPTQVATNVGGKIVTAPSSAEISQSNATDVTYDSRKTKAKGRSMTILTNSRGVGKNTNAVLGTKSLLGRA
jgi:hypothetical protein